MTVLAGPLLRDRTAPLARRNPLAKLGAALVVMVGLFLTLDALTPALLLAVELVAFTWSGLSLATAARRLWPLLVAVPGLAVTTAVLTEERGGTVVLDAGPLAVTTGGLLAALAVALRVLAIALPGVVAVATIDPTDLADALVQQLHASPRFTFGALAAFRMVPLLGEEWRTLQFARRARGMDGGRSPVRQATLFFATVFALLVAALRRGVRLAAAMDARGFGHRRDRTSARIQRMDAADWALLCGAAGVMAAATAVSVAAGTWTFLL